jgi:aminoglycoside phosphotransferase family enzyme/predicted kinase
VNIPEQQQEVAGFLAALAGREAIQTHISAVFVGADTVWKLKKAVRMPFLDFSTVDGRAHFLRRELALNKPSAPGIYRDVIAVSRRPDGSLMLGGDKAIDWVLRMAPVPSTDFLDAIAVRGALTPRLLDDLGDCVAAYHAGLAPVTGWDSAAAFLRVTRGNAVSALAAGLPDADVRMWQDRMESAVARQRGWLTDRSVSGYVRRCHGDLHLGNICLWEGKPVAFDALEFDEALATIDVGYDLAFLLMDLDMRVGRGAANRVMNRYVARTGDIAVAGFPMFLSQRAMIRAHVLAAMGRDAGMYLDAAAGYLAPAPPVVVAIGGLQGTGKSTLARAVATALGVAPGALVVRSDETRKRLHGAAPEGRLPPEAYSDVANVATNQAVIAQARVAALAGHAVIVDATFLDVAVRRDLATVVGQAGIPFVGIWLQAPLSVLEARVGAREGDASDATVAVLRRSAAHNPGPGDWLAVDAGDGTQALQIVLQAIRSRLG